MTYSYNALDDRTKRTPTSGTPTSYTYNQISELTGYARGTTSATYAYNGTGQLMTEVTGGVATAFVWGIGQATPLVLMDGTTSYVYGPGDLPIEQVSGSGVVTFLHHDATGSTTLLTNTSGQAVGSYEYDSYGEIRSETGAATTSLLFAGQLLDPISNLYYMGARYYDPSTGQFMSSDPLVALTGTPYSYAGDDPVNFVDPSGLWTYADTWATISFSAAVVGLVAGVVLLAPEATAVAAVALGYEGTLTAAGVLEVANSAAWTATAVQDTADFFSFAAASGTFSPGPPSANVKLSAATLGLDYLEVKGSILIGGPTWQIVTSLLNIALDIRPPNDADERGACWFARALVGPN